MAEPVRVSDVLPTRTTVIEIPLGDIDEPAAPLRSSFDPVELERLADDMARRGLLQPVGLVEGGRERLYEIVWGHRRFMAARVLGWATISARVFPAGTPVVEARIAENEIREDLNPVDQARYCRELLDGGLPVERIAGILRRSVEWIKARVELLDYPADVQEAVTRRRITLAVARELACIDYEPHRIELLDEAIRGGATSRVVATWRAAYQADRARIITNDISRDEILKRREELTVTVACEWCTTEHRIEHTRIVRLCAECTRQFYALQRESSSPPGEADP